MGGMLRGAVPVFSFMTPDDRNEFLGMIFFRYAERDRTTL
jgi:hypothetical protein